MAPEAFFLTVADAPQAQRYCLYHGAAPARAAMVYVHPFAEEMNKSRRMAALQARRLAEQGIAVLQIDLHGCGDSAGDFGDASWESWRRDLRAAYDWLHARFSDLPFWFWGLRSGCLLAAEVADVLDHPVNLLFWQPSLSGKAVLQQFLRLKLAGDMLAGSARDGLADLKARLAAGEGVEIAGYRLSAALARGLECAVLQPPVRPARVCWFETATRSEATLAPASLERGEVWRTAGWTVDSAVLPAPSFWQTTEIEEVPALLAATLAAVQA